MKRDRMMVVRLSKTEREGLDQIAQDWGTPRADVLRWGLRALLIKDPKFREFTDRDADR
jgi:hypothetical protein